MRGPGAVAYRERCHCPAGGRGIPAGDSPPFTAPAWFPPAEISSAGAALKTCPRQVFFTLRQSKENRRGGKMPRLGRFVGIRGSCEAVRRASMAPSTLRLTLAGEEPGPRITTAAEGRGEKSHLPLLLFPRVPLCYALARRSRRPCSFPDGRRFLLPCGACGGGMRVLADLVCSSSRCRWPGVRREPERRADIEIRPYGKMGRSAARHRYRQAEPMTCRSVLPASIKRHR